MKKSWLYKFGFLVLVLTLVTTSLVAGTYAKYTTTITATDSVTVARWVAEFGDDTAATTASIDFDLFETFSDTGVDGDLLAPGTSGTFDVVYETNTTQVARDVDITMNASSLSGLGYLKFYLGTDNTGTDITAAVLAGTPSNLLNATYGPAAVDGDGTINVYWEWPFSAGGAQDTADTTDGITPITAASVTITFTATQLDVAP